MGHEHNLRILPVTTTIQNWKNRPATGNPDLLWSAIRKLWASAAIAAFPFLFILDAAIDTAFSPVLPGMIFLVLLWALAPYGHMEATRKLRIDVNKAAVYHHRAKISLIGAFVWLGLWVIFG
jgi:hypothetical protein